MERIPYRATAAASLYDGIRLPMAILLHNVRSMYNVGAFFRAADGAGVERLLLSGITARPPKGAISKTALGAEERVPWESVDDPQSAMDRLRSDGYEVAAIETSVRAVDIFDWSRAFPFAWRSVTKSMGWMPAYSNNATATCVCLRLVSNIPST